MPIEKINSEYPYNLAKRFESDSDRLQFFMTYDIIPEIKTVKESKVDILRDYYIPSYRRSRILFSHHLINAIKNEDLRHNWQIRLAKQIKDLPAYKYLVIELEELIREKLINT